MRRKDREMDATFAWQIFEESDYSTLSMVDEDGSAYGIPVSAVHKENIIYIHCAMQGKKIDLLPHQKRVCLSAVSRVSPVPAEFTTEYASGIFKGEISLVENDDEKIAALRLICEKYAASNMHHFDEAIQRSLSRTAILRIDIDEVTGKRKKYDPQHQEMKQKRGE